MNRWHEANWRFTIEVLRVGKDNKAEECRLGLEPGDAFTCTYETLAGFCPTSFIKKFPSMEVVRCGGDLRNVGGKGLYKMTYLCPDGAVWSKITGEQNIELHEGKSNDNKLG